MPRHRRKTKGGGLFGPDAPPDPNAPPAKTLSQRLSDLTPSFLKSAPPPPPTTPLPEPIQTAVEESQEMAKTAGRRLKKHIGGYDIASGKSMRKLLGTAKDNMLGGKRRRRKTHRRR